MALNVTSQAAAVAAAVENVTLTADPQNVPRRILLIGTYDPLKTAVVDEVPILITSPEDAGDKFGYGFMLHRLAVQAFAGSRGVETYCLPQAEPTGAQSAGDITFTASGLLAGTVKMYIAGLAVSFTVDAADTSDDVTTKAIAAINAIKELPVTALVNVTPNIADITAKTEGTFGDDISIKFNLSAGEALPTGLTTVVTDMTGGTGTPTIADALNGLGTGDNANELFFTDVVHGYLQDSTTLDSISAYVGAGNEFTGLYSKTVARPFRVLTGDIAPGSAALTALLVVGNGRKTDRANGIIAVPDSASHPSEIAAQAMGHMARINIDRAAESYAGIALIGIDPGVTANRWTSAYDSRDSAVKAGISPTLVANGVVEIQNVVTFYHPDSVPVASNGYRSMRNISIIQNMLNSVKVAFQAEKYQGISIVDDTSKVTNTTDRVKARDIAAVIDELTSLANAFESKAWIYQAAFTIEQLAVAGAVSIRSGNTGFDSTLTVILSGEGSILDTVVKFDTSIAILLA